MIKYFKAILNEIFAKKEINEIITVARLIPLNKLPKDIP
jgi:hypothetical protein